jgi:NitT/TauT family transport system substrate-binding protein
MTTTVQRSAALTLIGGGLAAGLQPVLAQTAGPVVRIGAMAVDACGVAFYGIETGIFQSNGVNAQVTTVGNGAIAISGVLAGDLDVGMGNAPQIAVAVAKGLPLQMIAPAALYSKKNADPNLVVSKDAPFTSAKDLAGATIGVSTLGDFNQLSVFGWFDANKVPHDKVKFIELKFSEMGQALQRGIIQAAIITEPQKGDAVRAGLIRDFGDTYIAIAPEIASIIWFSTKDWVQKNNDLAKRLVKAIFVTGDWANKHTEQAGAIFAKVAKMDPALVTAILRRRVYATKNDKRYIEPVLALSAQYGMLPRPMPFEEFSAF